MVTMNVLEVSFFGLILVKLRVLLGTSDILISIKITTFEISVGFSKFRVS